MFLSKSSSVSIGQVLFAVLVFRPWLYLSEGFTEARIVCLKQKATACEELCQGEYYDLIK